MVFKSWDPLLSVLVVTRFSKDSGASSGCNRCHRVLTNKGVTRDVQLGTLLPMYNRRMLAAFIYSFHTSDTTLAPGVEL